ncbi:hypothetical protein R1flu_005702 [Riccia fluitans]|uniref:Uncharacterized protein n=1 Tax=Riccia fluitans TaxID=41844 RepID=A0ABD1YUL7_9MARC
MHAAVAIQRDNGGKAPASDHHHVDDGSSNLISSEHQSRHFHELFGHGQPSGREFLFLHVPAILASTIIPDSHEAINKQVNRNGSKAAPSPANLIGSTITSEFDWQLHH